MPSPEPPLLSGLELLRPIGQGSFGEVWLARTVTGQYRAVKLVPLGAEGSGLQALGERVFRGVQAYLDHLPPGSPAALAVLHVDHDPAGRFLYYVMELADDVAGGRTFAPEHYQALTLSEFRRRSPEQYVPARETIRLGRQLAEGLATLHAAGLVHRDIKPNNVVFIGGEPRLADIDLVRPAEASLSLGGAQGYSPLEGPGRPAADVFSLGRTLYATVTGLPVGEFPRLPEDWDQRPDAADLQRLNAVLLRACDPDPARRHQHGAELAEDFRRLEQGEDVARSRRQRARTRRFTFAATMLAAALAVTLSTLVPAYRHRREQAEFERYREQINNSAIRLREAGTIQTAALSIARTNVGKSGLEATLLERQLRDLANAQSPKSQTFGAHGRVERIVIGDDGAKLAVLSGTEARIFSLPNGEPISAITNISHIMGFLRPGQEVVGLSTDRDRTDYIGVWSSLNGRPVRTGLKGKWIPAGVLGDGKTVVALPQTEMHHIFVRWLPLADDPPERVVWNPSYVASILDETFEPPSGQRHEHPVARINRAGNRLSLKETRYRKIGVGSDGHSPTIVPTTEFSFAEAHKRSPWGSDWICRGGPSLGGAEARVFEVSPDGEWFAWVNPVYPFVSLDHVETVEESMSFPIQQVDALAVTESGKYVAIAESTRVRVVERSSGATCLLLSGHSALVTSIAWSTDTKWLVSGDASSTVNAWRIPGFSIAENQRRYVSGAKWLAADAGESIILVGEEWGGGIFPVLNQTALLNSDSLQSVRWKSYSFGSIAGERARFVGHKVPLYADSAQGNLWALAPDGRLVKSALAGTSPKHQLSDGIPNGVLFETNAIVDGSARLGGVADMNGRRFIVYSDKYLALWAVEGGSARRIAETNHPLGAQFTDAVISSDSRWAVVLADDGSALLANLDTGASRLLRQLNEKAVTACFRPDSTQCYFGTAGGQLLRLETATDDPPELLDANFGLPAHMIATPDGERLLTAGPGEQLGIRRLPDGAPIVQLTHHGLALESGRHNLKRLLYLPKQQRVVSLSEDGWLTQW